MATTTNYNWTTPNDTDLVKDGAAAIRSLGTAIDTTVFTNAGAAIAKSIIDAEGDLLVGDAADAVQRLAIGSNGNVLTVDTAVDGKIKWAAPAGGGKVLQVVSASSTTSTAITTGTFTDTTLSASITPSSATSKILILVTQVSYLSRAGNVIFASGRIMRDATSVFSNNYIMGFGVPNATGTIEYFSTWSPIYLDSPATTSAITYKTQQAVNGSGSITAQFTSEPSAITLMEIGA